jgi:hypothetical protein
VPAFALSSILVRSIRLSTSSVVLNIIRCTPIANQPDSDQSINPHHPMYHPPDLTPPQFLSTLTPSHHTPHRSAKPPSPHVGTPQKIAAALRAVKREKGKREKGRGLQHPDKPHTLPVVAASRRAPGAVRRPRPPRNVVPRGAARRKAAYTPLTH